MTTGSHLVHEAVYEDYVAAMADKASHLPAGDPATGQVALGPIIDERQRDKVHALVTASTDAGARLAAGGTYEGLFYKPTVLADVTQETPAYANEGFGPVAPVLRFGTVDEVAAIAANSEYGLSLGILTRDVMRGLDLARRIPSGIVHINDQTVDDEPTVPFGGGARLGHRHPLRRHRQPGGLHGDALGHDAGGYHPYPSRAGLGPAGGPDGAARLVVMTCGAVDVAAGVAGARHPPASNPCTVSRSPS